MNIFIKLDSNREYIDFDIYDGVYSSIDLAISEIVSVIPSEVNIKILQKEVNNHTFVIIVSMNSFSENEFVEFERRFMEEPLETAYIRRSGIIASFCLHEVKVN